MINEPVAYFVNFSLNLVRSPSMKQFQFSITNPVCFHILYTKNHCKKLNLYKFLDYDILNIDFYGFRKIFVLSDFERTVLILK